MNTKAAILVLAGLVVVGVAVQSRARRVERAAAPQETEPVSARSMTRPRLPAPPMRAVVAADPDPQPAVQEATNAIARLMDNEGRPPGMSRAQIMSCLEQNRRSAESLLAAFRLTRDRALLQEAAEKYPNDPRVHYAGWISAYRDDNSSPEERRQWLEAFKQSAPENALANHLSVQD